MQERIYSINALEQHQNDAERIQALEQGKVILFPRNTFSMKENELSLLTDKILDGKHKNISFDYTKNKIGRISKESSLKTQKELEKFMKRFALYAKDLVDKTLPDYQNQLIWGRTSYRPAQAKGRSSSKRKDDTRLHVDSFPASPVNGMRILRVFCNINPNHEPRVWNLGEPFSEVVERFLPQIKSYSPIKAKLLHWIRATKSLRSVYDHYMLHLHDSMKLDDQYQKTVSKTRFEFPAQSTWMVFTDAVSHAALSGQFLLEQTFYLPVKAMHQPELSPEKILLNAVDSKNFKTPSL